MRTLYFDCFSGASGDMIVGALIDAGADFGTIREALDTLGVSGYRLAAERIVKRGVAATQFRVEVAAPAKQPPRHLHDILELIEKGDLPDAIKEASTTTFQRLADCEAAVHGMPVEKVHFHEVGAVDSIMDVVGAHMALHLLAVDHVVASPLPVGSGAVSCAHGVMPVPAPATALLLEGAPCYGGDIEGELVTPTGAALISRMACDYGPLPPMCLEVVGYGSGTRDLPDRPNVLRVLIGEAEGAGTRAESIMVIEANIDDMNPELYPPLIIDLLGQGARDAFITPIIAKKGRPGHLVTVLCDEAQQQAVVATLLKGTTTLGIRMRREQRLCLDRKWRKVKTQWGTVRVKLGLLDGQPRSAAPEFDDCRRLAEEAGVPALAIYEAALAAAVKGEMEDV